MGIAYHLGGKVYDFLDEHFEKTRYGNIRKKILKNLKGKILDAGCGTGRNFQYYNEKAMVIGIDISSKMLEVAKKRAYESNAKIEVLKGDLRNLKFKDNSFDNAMASFVLCVIPERYEKKALEELVRVTKPGGKLYFLEYVYSKDVFRRFMMKITSFIPKLLYSLRFDVTLDVIKKHEGLEIDKLELVYEDVIRLIVAKKKGK